MLKFLFPIKSNTYKNICIKTQETPDYVVGFAEIFGVLGCNSVENLRMNRYPLRYGFNFDAQVD